MSTAAADLSEPHVLAHAKRRLFPDPDEEDAYAVVDTQFARTHWLKGEPIDPEIRSVLSPFNHVRIGSGYPDLVGVRKLEDELLAVERFGEQSPLVVEAKGYGGSRDVDVEEGIVQAYDRLHEANAAFLAAPTAAISQSARTLARELNVGVLAVEPDGYVEAVEVPRIVGNRTTPETMAIRFQASAQGVAEKSFSLNHPKNYLAYPLAVYHRDDTDRVVAEYVVNAVEGARQGAAFLGLIDDRPHGDRLTPLGREVVRFALREYGSVATALEEFDGWKRSRRRFVDEAPRWAQLARRVVYAYPATKLLVEELQQMHDDGIPEPTLVDLVEWLHVQHPSFAVELFVRGEDAVRRRILGPKGELRSSSLIDGNVYHSPTVFQLKAMLFHAGFLTERGREPSKLDPTSDVWALCEPLDPTR